MKKKLPPIQYDYYVHVINENGEPAYKAIIPAFNNAVVYGENLGELEEGIRFSIESEIAEREKAKKPVPKPEKDSKFSGKILIRITPLLHEQITLASKSSKKSLNKYIEEQLK